MENHLLLIGYYGLADGYLAYGDYFKNHFHSVSFYPLAELFDRLNENNLNFGMYHFDEIVTGTFNKHHLYSNQLKINNGNNGNNAIKYIIICHNNDMLKKKDFMMHLIKLKQKYNIKLIQINWDSGLANIANHSIVTHFDLSYNSDPLYIKNYPMNCRFFKAGYNKNTSFKSIKNIVYDCDVSFIGTNLYTDAMFENKTICRKKVLDKIYANDSIKLHVYGSLFLQQLYPKSYKGFIHYTNCHKVFSNSKICINISMNYDRNHDGNHYFSERLPQILACESIILSNNDFGDFLQKDVDYIYISTMDELIPKIKKYLSNENGIYDKMLDRVRAIKHQFEYENTIKNISNEILNLSF